MVFTKDWYLKNPHPRGMFGKNHNQDTKEKLSSIRKGKKLPRKWIKNISRGKTGIPRSEETKKKISLTRKRRIKEGKIKYPRGNESVLWRGGLSSENHLLRQRREYKYWRNTVFKRDDYTCQWCGARSGNGKRVEIQADHVKPFSKYPKLRYAIDNGRTLCTECHKKTDSYLNNKI